MRRERKEKEEEKCHILTLHWILYVNTTIQQLFNLMNPQMILINDYNCAITQPMSYCNMVS